MNWSGVSVVRTCQTRAAVKNPFDFGRDTSLIKAYRHIPENCAASSSSSQNLRTHPSSLIKVLVVQAIGQDQKTLQKACSESSGQDYRS